MGSNTKVHYNGEVDGRLKPIGVGIWNGKAAAFVQIGAPAVVELPNVSKAEWIMSTVSYPHIETNADGVAIIAGTTIKVVEIVQDHLAHHWHAEDIHRQHPHLSLAQIHGALTYYYDHQQEIEQEIDRRLRRVAEIKARRADGTIQAKLRQFGHLP